MAFDNRSIRAHLDVFRIVELAFCCGNVLWNINHNGTGPASVGDVEGLFHRYGDIVHILDQEVVFHAGTGDPDSVAFLKSILTDIVRRYLPGDDDQRDRIHISCDDTRYRVGRTRTRGY